MPTRRSLTLGLLASACVTPEPDARTGWPLWRIERGGGLVWLTGEIPPRRNDWQDSNIQSVAAGCDVIWTETNRMVRGNMRDLIALHGLEASPLRQRLSPEDYGLVEKAAVLAKLPLTSVSSLRPWLVAQQLDDAFFPATGLTGRTLQAVITDAARAANKQVESEFAAQDDVVAWLGSFTPSQNLQYLRYTLDQVLAPPADETVKFEAFSRGDLAPAAKWVTRMREVYPDLHRAMVVDRNRAWLPRIESALASHQPTLVITGLYHLVTPEGIPAQLSTAFPVHRV